MISEICAHKINHCLLLNDGFELRLSGDLIRVPLSDLSVIHLLLFVFSVVRNMDPYLIETLAPGICPNHRIRTRRAKFRDTRLITVHNLRPSQYLCRYIGVRISYGSGLHINVPVIRRCRPERYDETKYDSQDCQHLV